MLNELWAVPVAFTAGVFNAVAGGGTFLTFPTLNAIGLPQRVANMSSTVALWPGLLSGAAAGRKELEEFTLKQKAALAVLSIAGGATGALILVVTPASIFRWIVPWLLLAGALVLGFGPRLRKWAIGHKLDESVHTPAGFHPGKPAVAVMVAALSIYMGYYGAGAGIMLLAGFAMAGLDDVHTANAVKLLVQSSANLAAVCVFLARGALPWGLVAAMAIASSIGGFAGQRWSRRLPGGLLRGLVVTLGIALAVLYFIIAFRKGAL